MPRVTRINEFDLAAQNFLQRFETTQYSFQQSMHHFSTATSSPLRSQIKNLETLVNQSLAPRVRAAANDAEDMCVQLNTTSTLAVKQLSDALDKGVRKRRRRLRWIRRTGFMFLEWALVAMLWWVWLIVMAFKLVRGIFRGFFSGVRWVLWL
jgi:spore coat protein CotF